eukprot:Gb_23087 [translate_table: standard]
MNANGATTSGTSGEGDPAAPRRQSKRPKWLEFTYYRCTAAVPSGCVIGIGMTILRLPPDVGVVGGRQRNIHIISMRKDMEWITVVWKPGVGQIVKLEISWFTFFSSVFIRVFDDFVFYIEKLATFVLPDSRFTQQELPACKPLLTPGWDETNILELVLVCIDEVMTIFVLVGLIFIPIGVASLIASHKVVEIVDQYETECVPPDHMTDKVAYIKNALISKNCTRTLRVPKHMKSPVYVYYQLDHFYQNHRRTIMYAWLKAFSKIRMGVRCEDEVMTHCYSCQLQEHSSFATGHCILIFHDAVGNGMNKSQINFTKFGAYLANCYKLAGYVKSRSDKQLRHGDSEDDTDSCKPEATNNNASIVPCGLIAWSLFNDTYSFKLQNKPLSVNKRHISWKSDREHKFGKHVFPKNFQNGTLIGGARLNESEPLSEQEDLIVWMRTAALPTFRKLYGKIEEDLHTNDEITVQLQNNYNTYSFNGKKKLVLSTTSWLGGKNDFLGIAYLTVGGLCFFLATVFFLAHMIKPRTHWLWSIYGFVSLVVNAADDGVVTLRLILLVCRPLGDPAYLSWNRNRPDGQSS